MHSEWEEMSKHEVVSMEKIQSDAKQLLPPKKVTLYCSHHEGMKLDLYCETCGELICLHCTVNMHCRPEHKYDLVGDTFQRHKAEITTSLKPVEEQVGLASRALELYGVRSQELDDLEVAMEANIGQEIQKLQEILEARKAELVGQMKQLIQMKRKNLAAQMDEVETVHTQLVSCLSFMKESLRTGSQGVVIKMKKAVKKQIKEITDNFKPDILPPCELADVKFTPLPELTQACHQFGDVYIPKVSPEKCHVTGKGMEVVEVGERTTAVLHILDLKGEACSVQVEAVSELVLNSTSEKTGCLVEKTNSNQYEINYQVTSQGKHQLHIKVEGEHIKGSPFCIIAIKKLGTPIMIIDGVKGPRDVAVNQRGQIIVGEGGSTTNNCVSIFNLKGQTLHSFGSKGSTQGQFDRIRGVAVDDDGNIYVADGYNHRIQKFTPGGSFITAVGRKGSEMLHFNVPKCCAIHPLNKKMYVADYNNGRIQVLNPDLTFSSSFGSCGCGSGEFNCPSDVAFDSTGNVYVADLYNDRIQVFTAEGEFVRKFGQHGSGSGELYSPSRVIIDSDNVVYVTEARNNRISVFTCEGKFLTSFGKNGNGPGEFSDPHGIAVDKDGVIYVCDTGNNRVQLF